MAGARFVCLCLFSLICLCFSHSSEDQDSAVWNEDGINRFGIAEPEFEVRNAEIVKIIRIFYIN